MPSQATVTSRNAHSRYSELHIANHMGGIFTVASVTTTTIVLVDASLVGGKTLYAASTPGMVVIVEGVNASDVGKTANITGFATNTLTVNVDFATTPALAAGDLVAVVPPMASKVTTNGGHGLQVSRTKDETLGLNETVLTHNTALQVDPSGPIPFFLARDSQAVARLLLAGIGAYKKSGTAVHNYVPPQVSDGTYTEAHDHCFYTQDGNGVIEKVWLGMMGSQLDLNFPQTGVATANLQNLGTHVVREVGGSGKTFPSGSNNWNRGSDIERDSGNRHVFSGVLARFGGAFNAAMTSQDRYLLDLNVQIMRGLADDTPLGGQDRAVPVESDFGIRVSGRRIVEDDTIYQDFFGTSADATPGQQTETRLHILVTHPGDTTKTLELDIPYGMWTVDDIQREKGRFKESFTYVGKQAIASGAYDTANPLYRLRYTNGNDVDLLAAL